MSILDIIIKVLLGVLLFVYAVIDIRKKEISNIALISPIAIFLLLSIWNKQIGIVYSILGTLIGVILIGISKVTKGKIGIGDGFVFCSIGLAVGLWHNLEILMLALFLSALYSIYLLMFRHANRHVTIPFIPFIFAGYLGVLLL